MDEKKMSEGEVRFLIGVAQLVIDPAPLTVGEAQELGSSPLPVGGTMVFRKNDRLATLIIDGIPRAVFANDVLARLCALAGCSIVAMAKLHDLTWMARRHAATLPVEEQAALDAQFLDTLTEVKTILAIVDSATGVKRLDHSECLPRECKHKELFTAGRVPVAPPGHAPAPPSGDEDPAKKVVH